MGVNFIGFSFVPQSWRGSVQLSSTTGINFSTAILLFVEIRKILEKCTNSLRKIEENLEREKCLQLAFSLRIFRVIEPKFSAHLENNKKLNLPFAKQ